MFYIVVDNEGNLKSLKDLAHPETAIEFHEDSIEFARELVLTQTSEIATNKVYGPFDFKTYAKDENDHF